MTRDNRPRLRCPFTFFQVVEKFLEEEEEGGEEEDSATTATNPPPFGGTFSILIWPSFLRRRLHGLMSTQEERRGIRMHAKIICLHDHLCHRAEQGNTYKCNGTSN